MPLVITEMTIYLARSFDAPEKTPHYKENIFCIQPPFSNLAQSTHNNSWKIALCIFVSYVSNLWLGPLNLLRPTIQNYYKKLNSNRLYTTALTVPRVGDGFENRISNEILDWYSGSVVYIYFSLNRFINNFYGPFINNVDKQVPTCCVTLKTTTLLKNPIIYPVVVKTG